MNARVTVDLRSEAVLKIDVERHQSWDRLKCSPFLSLLAQTQSKEESVMLVLTLSQAHALRRVLTEKLKGKEGEG